LEAPDDRSLDRDLPHKQLSVFSIQPRKPVIFYPFVPFIFLSYITRLAEVFLLFYFAPATRWIGGFSFLRFALKPHLYSLLVIFWFAVGGFGSNSL
jgi:hypothetical protein